MKIKGTFKFGEQNENVHYEIDKDKGYWRQWYCRRSPWIRNS